MNPPTKRREKERKKERKKERNSNPFTHRDQLSSTNGGYHPYFVSKQVVTKYLLFIKKW